MSDKYDEGFEDGRAEAEEDYWQDGYDEGYDEGSAVGTVTGADTALMFFKDMVEAYIEELNDKDFTNKMSGLLKDLETIYPEDILADA